MVESDKLRNPHPKGKNHAFYKNLAVNQNAEPFTPAWKLPYAAQDQAFRINLSNFPSKNFVVKKISKQAMKKRKAIKEEINVERQVWAFFAATKWAPAEASRQGVTWLELYIRYALDGGQMQHD